MAKKESKNQFTVSRDRMCTGCDLYTLCVGRRAVEDYQKVVAPLHRHLDGKDEHPMDIWAFTASRCDKYTPVQEGK